jgi:D-alanine-D-alanine ligase
MPDCMTTDSLSDALANILSSQKTDAAIAVAASSRQAPLRVVVIHGDPSKPNDILPGGKWDEDDFYSMAKVREALEALGDAYQFTWLHSHDTLMDDLRRLKQANEIDLVLQLCDEGWMNNSRMELHITALLEMLDIPFSGIGSKTMGISYGALFIIISTTDSLLDKQAVLKIAESIGVPAPKSIYIDENDQVDPEAHGLAYPVMVKPNSTDGSFGITAKSVCHSLTDVKAAMSEIRNTFHVRGPVLFQEYLTGRDVNVGAMERRNPKTGEMEIWILPISEEDYSALPENLPRICGFESKVAYLI